MARFERGPQLSAGGIPSFMRVQIVDFGDLQAGAYAIVGAPLDTTTAWKAGSRDGSRSIREASLHLTYWLESAYEDELIDLESQVTIRAPAPGRVVDLGDLNVYPNQVARTAESFRQGIREVVASGAFPVILGGDHYVSFPCCQGFAEAVGKKVGYLQFGCELGLGQENPTWGRDWSGSQVRRLVETGVVEPRNVAWVGPTGLVPLEEYEWAKANDCTLLTAEEVHRVGAAEATRRALDGALRGCDTVYVSLGMDALDSSHAPGVGTPVIGGLTPTELGAAVAVVANEQAVGALDVVETAPRLDPSGRIQRLASNYVFDFLAPRALG